MMDVTDVEAICEVGTMRTRSARIALVTALAVLAGAGLFVLGRASAGGTPVHTATTAGASTATSTITRSATGGSAESDSYLQGLQAGEAQGLQEGRALQVGLGVPAGSRQPVQDAFNSGYAAGMNDAFAGYDGGWTTGSPYVVTLKQGSGGITYRIADRRPLEPKVNYFLCANGHDLCQEARN